VGLQWDRGVTGRSSGAPDCVTGGHCQTPGAGSNHSLSPPHVQALDNLTLSSPPLVADPPGALAIVATAPPHQDRYPSTLPTITLTEVEMHERYGIPHRELPRSAKNSLQAFQAWATAPINLDRGQEYAAPVQVASIEKTLEVMRAYMGWCCLKQGVEVRDVDIHLYADVHKFATFIGYLMARGVGHGQLAKQIAVAKKVIGVRG
jgi:hypothetical protein